MDAATRPYDLSISAICGDDCDWFVNKPISPIPPSTTIDPTTAFPIVRMIDRLFCNEGSRTWPNRPPNSVPMKKVAEGRFPARLRSRTNGLSEAYGHGYRETGLGLRRSP